MPVEFWAAPDSKVLNADQAVPTEYFYHALQTNLSKSFTLVDQPGPGVMTLHVALMDATTAVPGLRTVSVIASQVRVLNLAQFDGDGQLRVRGFRRSRNEDDRFDNRRSAGRSRRSACRRHGDQECGFIPMGDAQNAMEYWAQKIPNRILQLQEKSTQSQ